MVDTTDAYAKLRALSYKMDGKDVPPAVPTTNATTDTGTTDAYAKLRALSYKMDGKDVPDIQATHSEPTLGQSAARAIGYPVDEPATKSKSLLEEVGRTIGFGAQEFMRSFAEVPKDLGWTDKPLYNTPHISEAPSSTIGKVASTLVQFLVPYTGEAKLITAGIRFIPLAEKLVKAVAPVSKLGKFAATTIEGAVKGSGATFVGFSPNDPNLSAYLQSLPATQHVPVVNAITELLATDHNDSNALNRFRNVLEGMGMGAAVPIVLTGLGKGLVKTASGVSKVATNIPVIGDPILRGAQWIKHTTDNLIQDIADLPLPAKFIEEELTTRGKGISNKAMNSYETLRDFVSAASHAEDSLEKGTMGFTIDPHGNTVRTVTGEGIMKIVRDAEKLGPTGRKDLGDLLQNTYLEQLGRTAKEAPQSAPRTAANLTRLRLLPTYPELSKLADRYIELGKKHNDFLVQTESINGKVKGRFEYLTDASGTPTTEELVHVPLYREQELVAANAARSGRVSTKGGPDLAHKSRGWNTRKPSETLAEYYKRLDDDLDAHPFGDPFENIATKLTTQTVDGLRNRALVQLFNRIKELGPDADKWAMIRPKEASTITASEQMVLKSMPAGPARDAFKAEIDARVAAHKAAKAIDPTIEDYSQDVFKMFTKVQSVDEKSATFYVKGEKVVWDIKDPMLLKTIRALGPQHVSDFMRAWSKFGAPVKNAITFAVTKNPIFWLFKNPVRDTMTTSIVSRGGLTAFWDLIPGLKNTMFTTKAYEELKLYGGGFSKHGQYSEGEIGKILTNPGVYRNFMNGIESLINRTEMASRVQEYKKLLSLGYSNEKAAFLAREVGVDFANRGASAGFRAFAKTVPFLNASIQSWNMMLRAGGAKALFGRGLSGDESVLAKQVHAKMFDMAIVGGVFLPMIMYGSESFFNDPGMAKEYQAVPEAVRNLNFVYITPNGDGTYHRWLIPKPFEFALLTNLVEKVAFQQYSLSDRNVLMEFMKYTMGQTIARGGVSSNMPALARPIYDVMTNSTYTGGTVVPQGMEGGSINQRKSYTSPTAIFLADLASKGPMPEWAKSPMKVEYVINSFFGGIAAAIPSTLDIIAREHLDLQDPTVEHNRPEQVKSIFDIGGMAKNYAAATRETITQSGPLRTTRNENDFYQAVQTAKGKALDYKSVEDGYAGFDTKQRAAMLNDPVSLFWLQQHESFAAALQEIAALNASIDQYAKLEPSNLKARDELLTVRHERVTQIMEAFHEQLVDAERKKKMENK